MRKSRYAGGDCPPVNETENEWPSLLSADGVAAPPGEKPAKRLGRPSWLSSIPIGSHAASLTPPVWPRAVVALSVLGVLALLAAGLLALSGVTRHFTADGVERNRA